MTKFMNKYNYTSIHRFVQTWFTISVSCLSPRRKEKIPVGLMFGIVDPLNGYRLLLGSDLHFTMIWSSTSKKR